SLADLDYSIKRVRGNIELTINGYSDNAETLFNAIVKCFKTCRPSEQVFNTLKDSLLRQYQNFSEEGAIAQGLEIYQNIIYEAYVPPKEKALALQQVSYSQF